MLKRSWVETHPLKAIIIIHLLMLSPNNQRVVTAVVKSTVGKDQRQTPVSLELTVDLLTTSLARAMRGAHKAMTGIGFPQAQPKML